MSTDTATTIDAATAAARARVSLIRATHTPAEMRQHRTLAECTALDACRACQAAGIDPSAPVAPELDGRADHERHALPPRREPERTAADALADHAAHAAKATALLAAVLDPNETDPEDAWRDARHMRRDAAVHAALASGYAAEAQALALIAATARPALTFNQHVGLGVVPAAQQARITRSYTPGARQ